jgi:hypothetical protein
MDEMQLDLDSDSIKSSFSSSLLSLTTESSVIMLSDLKLERKEGCIFRLSSPFDAKIGEVSRHCEAMQVEYR